MRQRPLFLLFFLIGTRSSGVGEDPVSEVDTPAHVKPGGTALLRTPKGMHYFLQVPKSYRPKRGARLVIFMYGSNMNGLSCLRSFNAKRWATDDLIVCPNGEKGGDPYGSNNFTFGSAPYIAELTRGVQDAFRVTRTYLGGHSQGAFVTYSAFMNHPDLYDGAFPIAGDCWTLLLIAAAEVPFRFLEELFSLRALLSAESVGTLYKGTPINRPNFE